MVYVAIGSALLALVIGFVGGLALKKRTLIWCDKCGTSLSCHNCVGSPTGMRRSVA